MPVVKAIEEMTWKEVEDFLKKSDICIVSTGAIEQHGHHLPLGCDTYIINKISLSTAQKLMEEDIWVLVGPTIQFGVNPEAMNFPGSIQIHPQTLKLLIKDICLSLKAHGVRKILLLQGHDGNIPAMEMATQELMIETGLDVACVNWLLPILVEQKKFLQVQGIDGHAGAFETSRALATVPHLVKMDKAIPYYPNEFKKKIYMSEPPLLGGSVYHPIAAKSTTYNPAKQPGNDGDPHKATKEIGEQLLQAISSWLADVIKQEFLNLQNR